MGEASTVYQLGPWRRFTRLELPFGAISLIANSMMSWAGGWFVLTASEQFPLKNLRLPGLGSYLQAAADAGDLSATLFGLATLIGVNIGPNLTYAGSLATLLWRRIVREHDTDTDLGEFTRLGLLTVPAALILAVLALWASLHAIGG